MSRRRTIIKAAEEKRALDKPLEAVFIKPELPNMDSCPTCGRKLKPGRPRKIKHDDSGDDALADQ